MSGSKEERPTAADVAVKTETAAETAAEGGDLEMSAAEALARATEAAATPSAEAAVQAEPVAKESEASPDGEASPEEPPVAAVDEETQPVTPQVQDAQTEEKAETAPVAEAEIAEPAAEAAPRAEAEKPAAEAVPQVEAEEPATETAPQAEVEKPAAEAAPQAETEKPAAEAAPQAETEKPAAEAPQAEAEKPAAEAAPQAEAEKPAAEIESAETAVEAETAEPTTEKTPDSDTQKAGAGAAAKATAHVDARPEKAAAAKAKKKKKSVRRTPNPPLPDRPELRPVIEALESRKPMEGRVIGWNHGGFHLALGELSAFCPRSEMEIGEIKEPESYLDKSFEFRVLRLQGKGRRIVVSRAAQLRNEKSRQRSALRKKLQAGVELDGTVASLKDFGAFVDLGGSQGLVHVSEISHRRVEHPSDVLSEGQEVRVKVLKVEQGGNRISLSMRALEPNPWKDLADRFPQGAVVKGIVEKANQIGAFIELAPGLTGLLPARSMTIPRETTPARAYPPGKEVSVQIVSVDPRRQRISLGLEGSGLEGSRSDYKDYQRQSREDSQGEGFNALASAFRRLQGGAD